MKRIIYLLVAAIGLLVGCTPEEETWVQAGFTTDKESYEIGDLITLTNTSTAENARIAVCKWEFMGLLPSLLVWKRAENIFFV